MNLSIVLPSYGRPEVLNDCLNSIRVLKKELKNYSYEIIIINNNNSIALKKTSDICKRYEKELNIVELKSKPLGSVGARNKGIKKVRGDIVIFLDDDTLVQKDYFINIMNCYKDKRVGAVGGAELKKKGSIFHKLFFKIRKPGSISWSGEIVSNFSKDFSHKFFVKHLHGSNFSIKKDVLKEIGLMDESMQGHYRDETEFIYRVYELGYKIVFEPHARVIHTEASIGGNVSPSKKKDWAYWYHRNTGYFFFKHLYKGNFFKLIAYFFRELFMGLFRAIIYANPYFVTEIIRIGEGYKLSKKSS